MELAVEQSDVNKTVQNLFYERTLSGSDSSIINLAIGDPDPELLVNCSTIFKKATCHRMKLEILNQAKNFQYGSTSGPMDLRKHIAGYLTEAYQSKVSIDNIFITSGATQGLHLILSSLLDLNGYVFVDEVTFMFALGVIKDFHTLNIIKVKLNDDGVDTEDLRSALKKTRFTSFSKRFWGVYYTMTVLHNPTGITFSDRVCKQLVKAAREFDVLVICDDVYNSFYNDNDQPTKRLFEYDDPRQADFKGNVISNGSFSKIISPGIRLGWIEAPTTCRLILEQSGVVQSSGCSNNYTAGIMNSLFELGLAQENIEYVKCVIQDRMAAVVKVLRNKLPKSCSFKDAHGGYYIWIRMPEYTDCFEFLKLCLSKYNVNFICGYHFCVDGDDLRNYFRIAIVAEKTVLETACSTICTALHEYLHAS